MSDYTTCHTAWPETPSCTMPALVGLVASPPCSPARSNLWEPPFRTSWSRPWRCLPQPIPLPEEQCHCLINIVWIFTSGRISKIFWRAGSVTSKLPPVGGDALRSSVIPSPFHLERLMAHLIHVLWSNAPLDRLQFLLWNPDQLKEPDRAEACAELLQLRVLHIVEWGGKEFLKNSEDSILRGDHTKKDHLCH